ncbi:MAG: HEAT repeat domain-containing protein [Gemmataceae bacterium]|nr:HEAT repeat domain-containing protein [Gemmataceae bacterium]
MRRLALLSALLVPASLFLARLPAGGPPAPKPNQVQLNGHTFTLPPGFTIELVAGPPLVDRPIGADFDEQGRLYVSDSSGSNEPVKIQLQKKPHRIVRLVDTDGDGTFDKSTVFADKMMFPEGVMWLGGSVYIAAPPSIWKLTDTNGDGIADRREEWFDGKTLTGCANDLHGPYAGPDGWIYWCKGAFAEQTYERPGKAPLVTKAAHIFRARPDGSGVEPVMTGGMDNPVDVVFTPGGERIFTTTFFQYPAGGKRDGLIHAVYGGVYGKDYFVVYNHPWTSPALMPVLTHLGPAAPCGLTRYESSAFGPEYQDNLFACLFNLQKVTRHVLKADGATFTARDEDFLVSDNKDFHPTDVIEDADGSLLVIDTGGWYKLCCPTSQLVKPDVLGAIYRVRRVGAPRVEDPRGLKLDWAKATPRILAGRLDDPRPAVRRRAVQMLGQMGPSAVPALENMRGVTRTVETRRNAVWAATRIEHESARALARRALIDSDPTVRQVAAHSASVHRDRGAVPNLLRLLRGKTPANRRVAAEALGRIGDKSAVPALLAATAEPADRMLEHSLTYALIEIADPEGTAAGLRSASPHTRRAALVALDQMDKGKLPTAAVTKELAATDPKLRETAWWIAGRHSEWGATLSGFLRDRLAAKDLTPAEQEDLAQQLARLARASAVQTLLAERLGDPAAPASARQVVLRAMARASLKEAPAAWLAPLAGALGHENQKVVSEAVFTARSLRLPKQGTEKLTQTLLRVGHDAKAAASDRLGALVALPGGLTKVEPDLFTFLSAQVRSDRGVSDRGLAADVLARARLTREQLLALTGSLKSAGPMEVNRLLEAFGRSTDEEVGKSVVAALSGSAARNGLHPETIRSRLAKFGPAVLKQAETLMTSLDADLGKQKARLEELLKTLEKGDVRRGMVVFNSPKAACASCHTIGYLGGKVGPDLTRIGSTRSERDLLEAIVFPSLSFVQSYEPVVVSTHDGRSFSGVIRPGGPAEVVVATGPDQETRLAREEVENVRPGRVSVMPSGLDQQLTARELADLVAFLKACR